MSIIGSRKGAAGVTMLLMVLAFAGIGGFMYWLNVSVESQQVLIEEEPDEPEMTGMAFSDFATDPAAHLDTEITVQGVEVASLMGEHQFWTQLNPNTPFLVRLAPTVVSGGTPAVYGEVLTVTGTVRAMTPEILDGWIASGTMTEDQRFEAEFAEQFLDVTQAQS